MYLPIPAMPPAKKYAIIQEMLDTARATGRFETATKLARALIRWEVRP
jgi:hypothetical protein